MTEEGNDEMSAQQRAVIAYRLIQQRPMTTQEIAAALGISRQGAWALLSNISGRNVPICQDGSRWCMLSDGEIEETETISNDMLC